MGIKSLHKFLRTTCPNIFELTHLSEYAFKKVAIDISLYMCKFKTIYGDYWLSSFIKLVSCLRRNEIHCVFIYDTGSPPEKDAEKKERAAQRAKLEEKVMRYEDAIEEMNLTGEVPQILIDLYKKKKPSNEKRLLRKGPTESVNISVIEDAVKRMKNQVLNITEKDFALTRQLFDILNVPYFYAPLEAETMCSDLCKKGLVDAVLSEDSDVLAYGAPIFLNKIHTGDDTVVRINYEKMLGELELNSEEFLDFCIMCGTDYNKNIFRVGPKKAYKYIKEHKSIERIDRETKLNISILNHNKGRELFRKYEVKDVKIPYCGEPDFKKLQEFIFKNNIRLSVEGLKKDFVREIIIEE